MVRSPATSVHSIRQGSASASISESITGRAPQQANTRYAVEDLKGIKKFSHKHRQNSRKVLQRWPGWEVNKREPYHAYIHSLVHSGWDNMIELDNYMCEDYEDKDLVVSVLDITDDYKLRRAADIHDEVALTMFLAKEGREGVKVRLFMAEQFGDLASGVMEAFGSALDLDPRFFQWSVYGNNHLLSSSERHRAPFTSLTIPNYTTPLDTEREFFKVSIYILRDDQGDGWTGIILFNSHSKLDLSANILIPPPKYGPSFGKQISRPAAREPQSLRELYLSTFDFIDISEAAKSPFYAVHEILRINTYCWSRVITVVKAEDKRQEAISTEHVEHVEELEKSIRFVRRGGSLGWQFDAADAITTQCKDYLEEDLTHLKEEVDILWERRRRMAAIRERKRDARTNSLTNAFTFL
ncbi:MAG: hypothetical protein M1827_002159 [Pycnora praestabilis]|nr:MAG: hypothetical protein M1827_002159 [Pycnora praestabilis]